MKTELLSEALMRSIIRRMRRTVVIHEERGASVVREREDHLFIEIDFPDPPEPDADDENQPSTPWDDRFKYPPSQ